MKPTLIMYPTVTYSFHPHHFIIVLNERLSQNPVCWNINVNVLLQKIVMYNVNKDIKQFKPYMRTRILFFVKCLLPVPASPLKGEEQKA